MTNFKNDKKTGIRNNSLLHKIGQVIFLPLLYAENKIPPFPAGPGFGHTADRPTEGGALREQSWQQPTRRSRFLRHPQDMAGTRRSRRHPTHRAQRLPPASGEPGGCRWFSSHRDFCLAAGDDRLHGGSWKADGLRTFCGRQILSLAC